MLSKSSLSCCFFVSQTLPSFRYQYFYFKNNVLVFSLENMGRKYTLLCDVLHQIKAARLEYAPQKFILFYESSGLDLEPWRRKRALEEAGGDRGVHIVLLMDNSKSTCTKISAILKFRNLLRNSRAVFVVIIWPCL